MPTPTKNIDQFPTANELDSNTFVFGTKLINGMVQGVRIARDRFIGPQWPKGDKGDQWVPWPQGPKGEQWERWLTGEQWQQGVAWPVGPKGEMWEKGDAFVYSDFTPEQLESLRWPQGIQGPRGEQWPQGLQGERWLAWPKGDKGDRGLQGPQWQPWPQGLPGPQGPAGEGTGDMLKSENLAGLTNTTLARGNIQAEGIGNKVTNIEQHKTSNDKYPSVKALYEWVMGKLNGKANTAHTHTKNQITDFPTSMPASDVHSWAKQANKPAYNWGEITGKPATYPPNSHDHQLNDIVGLQTALNSKSNSNHIHSINGVSGLQEALNNKSGVWHWHMIEEIEDLEGELAEKIVYKEVNVTTAYNTQHKIGTTTDGGYVPRRGDMLLVNFVNGTQVSQPTLNIDGSGAKHIRAGYYNVGTNMLNLNRTTNSNIKVFLWYDGEYYQMFGAGHNSTYGEIPEAEITDPTKTHGRLISGRRMEKIKEHIQTNVPTPTEATHAVNKGYLDTTFTQRMGNLVITTLTQQEYDAIGVKDPTTLYLITS